MVFNSRVQSTTWLRLWRSLGCKLTNTTQNMAELASKPKRRGGRYCVAGAPNNQSFQNTLFSNGITMHQFPTDAVLGEKWIKFDIGETLSQKGSTHRCALHTLRHLVTTFLFSWRGYRKDHYQRVIQLLQVCTLFSFNINFEPWQMLLAVPKTKTKLYGDRSFAARAPRLWNALPVDIKKKTPVLLVL